MKRTSSIVWFDQISMKDMGINLSRDSFKNNYFFTNNKILREN
jgi:hypothetical protein